MELPIGIAIKKNRLVLMVQCRMRVAAETITETAIGAVMGHGSEIVVGAAVTATLGTAAAPGVVVIAISGAVVARF